MRLLLACAAAVAAVTFAAPSFAQDATPIETQTPAAKPKAGTSAYCNTLKSTSSKTSCLKRVHASAAKPVVTASAKKKAKGKKAPTDAMSAPKETAAQLTPPASAAPSSAPIQQAQPSSVAVPPLPQKTI
jgi:hypothetical protein